MLRTDGKLGVWMQKLPWLLLLLFAAGAITSSSVASYVVLVDKPEPAEAARETTASAYWWGIQSPDIPISNCESGGMTSVRFRQTFLDGLISYVTLGVWLPVTVEWQCSVIVPDDGNTDEGAA